MPTLADLQSAFARALDGDVDGAEAWVVGGGFTAAERLSVYRHNGDALLHSMLAAAYPAVERLAGADYLRGLVPAYRAAYPSTGGNLHQAVAALPDFLARELADSPYGYLADVARLEWAYQSVLVAADARAFDVTAFAALNPADHDRVVFTLAPSVRVVSSDRPVTALWEAFREADEEATVDLDAGGETVLLYRAGREARLRLIDATTAAFLAALARGATLAQVYDTLESLAPDGAGVDVTALAFPFVRDGLIDGFRLG